MASEAGLLLNHCSDQMPVDQDMPCSPVLPRDPDGLRFFSGICSRDTIARQQALDSVCKSFDNWLEGFGSPKEIILTNGAAGDLKGLIIEQLPDLLRHAEMCPFADVRERCSDILHDLEEHGIKLPRRTYDGPSVFIPSHEIIPIDNEDEEVQELYVDAFLHNNRLEHMVQVMSYHPEYLACFLKTQQYMLRCYGPLPYDYRHYIAIMAAARHQCSYLINIQTNEFLLQGGDERWLKGLDHIPKKLRDLYELNKIMAHRPWLITRAHIEQLTKGNDNWSIAELTHAVVLLAHFHALSSFVYGCGINAEIDQIDGHTFRSPSSGYDSRLEGGGGSLSSRKSPLSRSPNTSSGGNSLQCTPNSAHEMEGGIEVLMEKMRRLTEEASAAEEVTQEELLKRFERVETLSAELPAASKQAFSPKEDILCYVSDPDFTYQDFAKRGTPAELPTFRAQDYSWEDHGFSLANRLYPDIGTYLDDKFNTAYNLTYYTMGDNTDVDTSSFRRSIWNYIHCMFGIRHDDYDYCEVNQLLERNLKAYVKTVTCYPERVTRRDYDSFMREFKHSEKVHVNLMLLEARMQAELLYALRAINRYMT